MYYKERCGRDTASLIAVDYDHQIQAMIENNVREKKIRILLTKDPETNLQVTITPMKRPRETTTQEPLDRPMTQEKIDAYKKWLENLQQYQPDTGRYISSNHNLYKLYVGFSTTLTNSLCAEFKDDYRDETIKTYKEWLRHQDYLDDICKFYSFTQHSNTILLCEQNCIAKLMDPFYEMQYLI